MASLTINFTPPFPDADNYRVGYRKKGSFDVYTYVTVGGIPALINGLDNNQDYEGTIESVCSGIYSTAVSWSTNQFNADWNVYDEWYACPGETCDGEALYCEWFEVRRESDNALIFRYDHDNSSAIKTGYLPSLTSGVTYKLNVSWIANTSKTNFGTTHLQANTASNTWTEPNMGSTAHSILFTGAGASNLINITVQGEGPLCICVNSSAVTVRLSNDLGSHCATPVSTVYVEGSSPVIGENTFVYLDAALNSPVLGYTYISDGGGVIYVMDSFGGYIFGPSGETC